MSARALRTTFIAILALIVTSIGAGVYVLSVVTSDYLTFRQHHIAYFIVTMSSTIRNFPKFSVIGDEVRFTYSAREGVAPEHITMNYDSSETFENLLQKHQAHCADRGYRIIPEKEFLTQSRLACDAPDYRIEIDIDLPRHNATPVTINFMGR